MDDDYDIVTVTEDDRERVADFLRQHFYKHSPLNLSLGIPPERPTSEIFSLRFIKQGKSLMAVTNNGQRILGLVINAENTPNDNHSDFVKVLSKEAYVKIETFVHRMEEDVDIWKLTGADRALYIHSVTVDPALRGRGIGKILMERSREIARAEGYPVLRVLCSNYFTIKIARSMDMESVYTLPYSEYKDENGVPIFVPPPPHNEAIMFIQKLT